MKRRNFRCVLFLLPIFLFISGCDKEEECNISGELFVSADSNTSATNNLLSVICPGESVVLSWSTTNADSVSIEADNVADVGSVDMQGTTVVSPTVSTSYRLVATSDNCNPAEIQPVQVRIVTSPTTHTMTYKVNDQYIPNWMMYIAPSTASDGLIVRSIDRIVIVEDDGSVFDNCAWGNWRVDKDGSTQSVTTPFPATVNPPYNPEGTYTLTPLEAAENDYFMTTCINLKARLQMTLDCPSQN